VHDHPITPNDDLFERGLTFDLATLATRLSRRRLLALGGAGLASAALAACASSSSSPVPSPSGASSSVSSVTPVSVTAATGSADLGGVDLGDVVEIPDETQGPYPGDGSNGINVLTEDGIVRSDIRSSFGSSSTVADGVPLSVVLTVADAATDAPLANAAVYIWHCDAAGNYSLYSAAAQDENYLRGVQTTDTDGRVTFTSIVPGCYTGRWPHIHFEVYSSLAEATAGANSIKTSQLAFPKETCDAVYVDARYPQSSSNLSRLSLATDNVFRDDGGVHQLATITGDASAGYVAALTVGV
jgi:protocatechuate 3,4-dioxygenase beta subunit